MCLLYHNKAHKALTNTYIKRLQAVLQSHNNVFMGPLLALIVLSIISY